MRKFHNATFDAPNVIELDIDPAICDEFATLAANLPADEFTVTQPNWNSDVKWIAPNTIRQFRRFQTSFNRLGVAQHVRPYLDVENTVRLYSGFLVSRSSCSAPDFHHDWLGANNEAFTLLAPIGEIPPDFGLLYYRTDGSVASYAYQRGKAIVFGDDFLHSTQPGQTESPTVLLSFTFGTDRMEHWPAISQTAGYQGNLIRLPDGNFLVRDIDEPDLMYSTTAV